MKTTGFSTLAEDADAILTGNEKYPIIGDLLLEVEVNLLTRLFEGLNKFWDCMQKNYIAHVILKREGIWTIQVAGSLMIMSADHLSSFGYYFNPPFEFHSWLRLDNGSIIDLALPGVIEKGLITSDSQGPYIIGRDPVILAGRPKSWMKYKEHIIL